jgi:thioesterase domain-containing protein
MLGDVKFHTHAAIEPEAAERWRQSGSEDELGDAASELLAELAPAAPPAAAARGDLAGAGRTRGPAPLPACLVGLQRGGDGRPLFLVHPVSGDVHAYRHLARAVGPERPIYGLQSLALAGAGEPHSRLEDMAAAYCQALRAVQPQGPYLLAGSSMGGVIAYEMAGQLRDAEEEVALLALVDSWLLDDASPEPGRDEVEAAVRGELGGGASLSAAELARLSEVLVGNARALRAYRPRPRTGSLVYFRAAASRPGERPQDAWSSLCSDGAEVHLVAGDHLSSLLPPHVWELGERLRGAIERSEAGGRGGARAAEAAR